MGTAIFKMLPSILLLVFLITVESTPNSNVTRALPRRYLDVRNFQKCMVDLVIPDGQPEYCIPLSQPDDCPKRVWRNLKRAYKDRKKRSPQSGGAPAPAAPAPEPRVCTAENSEPCQFPFKYKGKTYYQCTLDHNPEKAWCQTISNSLVDCNPGCPGYVWPRPPTPPDVKLENGIPEVYINGQYYPICGHFFWDNDNGVDLFCRELNYRYRSGEITHGRRGISPQRLNKDAVSIAKCYKDDILKSCTGGGCNNLQIGGNCPGAFGRGRCTAGARAGIKIRCSTEERQDKKTKRVKLIDKMPYVWRSRKWVPICGHYFWNNHNGAKLFCEELGFPEGKLIGGNKFSVDLPEDAL